MKKNLLIVLILSSACGKQGFEGQVLDNVNLIQSAFNFGRNIAVSPTYSGSPLTSEMFALERDTHSGTVAKITFDANQVESVSKDDLKSFALNYITSHADQFGVTPAEISTTEAVHQLNDSLISISFARKINDKPVRDALIELVFAKNAQDHFKLFELISRSYGGAKVEDSAKNIDGNLINKLEANYKSTVDSQSDMFFPHQDLTGKITLVSSTEVKLKGAANSVTTVTISKSSGEVLETYSSTVAEAASSAAPLTAMLYDRSYQDSDKVSKVVPHVQIGKNGVTNWLGKGDFNANGTEEVSLESAQFKLQSAPFTTTLTNGVMNLETANDMRTTNAFVALHRIHQFARKYYSDVDTKYFQTQVIVNTNVSGSCNAFYQGGENSVNFYSEGNGCANMAVVNDVIFHEWGHGLDNYTGKSLGMNDGAFSEGVGDIVSGYATGSSNLGQGFFKSRTAGIRQLNNNAKYPQDLSGEVHNDGLIIGGTFWDLRKSLMERYGDEQGRAYAEHLFFRHLITADTYKESYNIVLQLDNEGGNAAVRSPNFCLINSVFSKHGLAQEVANCQDAVEEMSVALKVETKISKVAAGGYQIVLKSPAEQLIICKGKKADCLSSRKDEFGIVKDGRDKNSNDGIFIGQLGSLPVNQTYHILGWDKKGQFVGINSFKLMKR